MNQWNHDLQAQLLPKLNELVGAHVPRFSPTSLNFMMQSIEELEKVVLGSDLQQSISLSKFKLRLQSGEMISVTGSALSAIEHATEEEEAS